MNVPNSVPQAVQPVYGEDGEVHDAHTVPDSGSAGKGVVVNGHLCQPHA